MYEPHRKLFLEMDQGNKGYLNLDDFKGFFCPCETCKSIHEIFEAVDLN